MKFLKCAELKKEVEKIQPIKVELEDTWGEYREMYLITTDNNRIYYPLSYRTEDAFRKYLEENNIPYTS